MCVVNLQRHLQRNLNGGVPSNGHSFRFLYGGKVSIGVHRVLVKTKHIPLSKQQKPAQMDSYMDQDEELSEMELIRLENIRMMNDFIKQQMEDPEMADALQSINSLNRGRKRSSASVKLASGKDSTFKFTGSIPKERKRSARLANVPPEFTYEELPEDDPKENRKRKNTGEVDDLETVITKPKRIRKSITGPRKTTVPGMNAEDVTDDYINKIAWRSSNKTYSEYGSCCHQCRQKTTDSKTFCRSGSCVGVRGQFCGKCLLNRYGEKADEVLRDPNWACPPCRGMCNCSICRSREGKRPTGILAPIAQQQGFKSVKDFLNSLNGRGDYVENDLNTHRTNNELDVQLAQPIKSVIDSKIKDMNLEEHVNEPVLLGFMQDLNAVMKGCNVEGDLLGFDDDIPVHAVVCPALNPIYFTYHK